MVVSEECCREGGVVGINGTEHAGRNSTHNAPRRDVAQHHGAGAHHGILTDGHAARDGGTHADPNVIFDGDGAAVFEAGGAQSWVDGVRRAGHGDVRGNEDPGADAHRAQVEDNRSGINEGALPQADIHAVIAGEGAHDLGAGPDFTE